MTGAVPAVDVHAHVAVPAVEALIAGEPGYAEQQRTDAATLGEASMAYNRAHFGSVIPRLARPGPAAGGDGQGRRGHPGGQPDARDARLG